ncbi:MAG: lactam utilization protein LamB [Flavobacteriaceae bacterium]|nr:lactam utilization protein LamB [Flavobacteriaceae bacterium]|tara:strand:+ start:19529 stop:20260 length:732 start_codon:yes stop_codon:yes gene_type:complete
MKIDINADVGEGCLDYEELFSLISSCNIACGGHIGDDISIKKSIKLAINHDVKIGAHPSFPDKLNFGRKIIKISSSDLERSLTSQINLVIKIAKDHNKRIHHVKPHGALYNKAFYDFKTCETIISCIKKLPYEVTLFSQYKSLLSSLAGENGIKIYNEVFIDREYNDDLSLVSRENKNAITHDLNIINKKVLNIIKNKLITSINNVVMKVKADTYCIHGDNPNALVIMKSLISFLNSHKISLK